MSVLVGTVLLASLVSVLERRRRREGGLDLDGLVLGGATWLAALGAIATLLAAVGRFDAIAMSTVTALGALAIWPWRRARVPMARPSAKLVTAGVVIVLGGLALRWPSADYPLAGRDQGTYTLRAQHTLREGRLHAIDPILASIHETRSRSGPADLRGLYPRRSEAWRRDRYEAAYRPGFYLADIDRGLVRPQFLHLHPMLMAVAGMVLGPRHVIAMAPVWSVLSLLGLWAVARRLWPTGPWSWLAIGLWATAPLVVWVQRTALSEGPATVLTIGAVLAVLRAREGHERELLTAALLLGAIAWVRGNGWLAAPVILAAQWLVPSAEATARRAGLVYALVFAASVIVHAPTTFPYLHDELLRQLPLGLHPTPGLLVMAAVVGVSAWFAIDELGPLRRHEARWLPRLHRGAPWALGGLLLLGLGLYLWLRVDPLARPFSRLDPVVPLVGATTLVLAALGLGRVLRRWPVAPSGAHAWMLGLGAVLAITVLLYAQRNLPQLGLYYYGRYLVPELLPALLLLAVEGLRGVHDGLRGAAPSVGRRRASAAVGLLGALGLGWSSAGVLVTEPVTRLQEFAGADRVVDHLAARIPEGAVVIAGGEGWHSGHTFNQVGGALAFRHGITVLPYESREAAYASLFELLVARPEATGEPAPPVLLLINEATKDHTRDPDDPASRVRVAALDDLLPPPFVARRIELVEMILQRLTPTHEEAPRRVTRDGLRMALLHVEIDPVRMAQMERWRITASDGAWSHDGPAALALHGGAPQEDRACLGPEPLTITLPEQGGAGSGPVSLVLVAAPGSATHNSGWTVRVDGVALPIDAPGAASRERDTLGPWSLATRPRTLEIRGLAKPDERARCPHGGLAELRLLGPEAPMLATAKTDAITFAPTPALGHPVEPVAWVPGRGLSATRLQLTPPPERRGLAMELRAGAVHRFGAVALPDAGREPIDLVVTLTGTSIGPSARVVLSIDGQPLPPIDPPDEREGTWQSPPLRVTPSSSVVDVEVRLHDAAPGEHVLLRDIGLFSRAAPLPGRLAAP